MDAALALLAIAAMAALGVVALALLTRMFRTIRDLRGVTTGLNDTLRWAVGQVSARGGGASRAAGSGGDPAQR